MKKLIYILFIALAVGSACKKSTSTKVANTAYEYVNTGDTRYAYLKVLNLTPGSPVVNFYIDGVKFSSALASSNIENAGYAYNGLFPDLGYAITSPSSHTFTAKVVPSASLDANLEVLNTPISPAAGKYYTIYTTGQYSASNKTLGTPLILEDVKPALDTSKIFIRFLNLCNGTPNIDVVRGATVAEGTQLIANIAYGTASAGWTEIPNPGIGTSPIIPFWYVNSSTGAPVFKVVTNITLSKGRAYTIYLRGVFGTTATATIPTVTSFTTFF